METQPDFATEIEAHLAAIRDLCLEAGRPGWAEHATLILGHPEDLQHAVLFGFQDLAELRRILGLVRLHQQLGYKTGLSTRE
jgi:hypothetical protein